MVGVDDTTRLAVAARDGDRAALAAFVRRTQPVVWRFCAHLASPADADDLTQETYVRAVRALPAFRAEASAQSWLLSIARRAVADDIRRVTRRRALHDRLRVTAEAAASRTGEVDLDDVVARLEPDRRTAFVLTQVVGFSYAEAAEVCDCPIGTIRSRVARARAELLAAVEDDRDEAAGC